MSNTAPQGWSVHELGDLADKIEGGGTPSRSEPKYWNGGIPWASVKDLRGIELNTTEEFISEVGLENSSSKLIPLNTMILASRMAVGKAVFFNRDVAINQDLKAFYPKDSVDWRFLLHWYLSKSELIAHLATGSTVKGIRLDDLKLLPIDLPPLPEQQKIATILSSVDDVIEKTRAQIDKLKDLKTGMMQELLTKGIGPGGVPHTEFKDSPVGRIPVSWSVLPLEKLVKAEKNITYGIVQAGAHCEGGVPYIRVSDMTVRALSRNGMLLTSPEIAVKYQRSAVSYGDIVYALRGVIGHVLLVPKELDGANLTQGTARISPNDKVDACYLLWAMKSPYVDFQNDLAAKGSTFREVTLASLRKIQIALPEPSEQKKIASIFGSVELKIFSVEDKLAQLKSIKKALMQDLLTGKVRVNLPDKASAAG